MAMLPVLYLAFVLVCVGSSIGATPPEVSSSAPAPAPEHGHDSISLTPAYVPAPSPADSIALSPGQRYDAVSPTPTPVPAPSPDSLSPSPQSGEVSPSPSPGDLASPSPSPSIAPSGHFSLPPTPALAPQMPSDLTQDSDDSDSGMSGGKKAGIAFGVVSSACLVGLAAKVYKKRQENIRRAQFGYYGNDDML